ncbi:MAG: hypothetical protein ACI835_005503 [Planctomycetota bacterium]
MANPFSSKNGRTILIVGILIALGLVAVWILRRHWMYQVVIALFSMVVLWILVDLGAKFLRQRKQRSFDERVAAKEGIEDRKREWTSWSNELRKQGIDKSTLPFYLLLGEPQSGKSVLLQNSDLRFPFGQNRLSGIGGTRGCDWWFTDEAVILDLAGRLFTHEGGRADEEEWEAFLAILAEYRPMCPADGVILILPCDSLLQDSESESTLKANRIQSSLLTLINKLQARLPVYVVLTKGDKLFGFAETVHRLDAQKRFEMFGWSREGDNYERPFELHEAHSGFDTIIERARDLRSLMLSTARIPEAIPEVDRLYAFPDELAALRKPLDNYLRVIFSESSLVDRLFFRGLYLTSGLQSGAPIAKVCSDMLGGGGEADLRDLEGLFAKQRAYFIKDFVRKRVFSERGLVQPTGRRVKQSQRNAWIGYGAASLITLASVVAASMHLMKDRSSSESQDFRDALDSTELVLAGNQDLPEFLLTLSQIEDAFNRKEEGIEKVIDGAKSKFSELYIELFDEVFVPQLRVEAELALVTKLGGDPDSYETLDRWNQELHTLLTGFDLSVALDREVVTRILGSRRLRAKTGTDKEFDLRSAVDVRLNLEDTIQVSEMSKATGSKQIVSCLDRMTVLWEGAVTSGKPWQVGGALGYMIAWEGLTDSYRDLQNFQLAAGSGMHAMAADYAGSVRELRSCLDALAVETSADGSQDKRRLSKGAFEKQAKELRAKVKELLAAGSRQSAEWDERSYEIFAVSRFSAEQKKSVNVPTRVDGGTVKHEAKKAVLGGLGGALNPDEDYILVPTSDLSAALDSNVLVKVSEPSFLPLIGWDLIQVEGELTSAVQDIRDLSSKKETEEAITLSAKVVAGKLKDMRSEHAKSYPNWDSIANALEPNRAAEGNLHLATIVHLTRVREGLRFLDPSYFRDWIQASDDSLFNHLAEKTEAWKRPPIIAATDQPPTPNWEMVEALYHVEELEQPGANFERYAKSWADYLVNRISTLVRFWKRNSDPAPTETNRIVVEFSDQLKMLQDVDGLEEAMERKQALQPMIDPADGLIAGRITSHLDDFRSLWRSRSQESWFALSDAVTEATSYLDREELRIRYRNADGAAIKTLRTEMLEMLLRPRSPDPGAASPLPLSRAAMDEIGQYRVKSESAVLSCDFLKELRLFVGGYNRHNTAGIKVDTQDVERYLDRIRNTEKAAPPEGAGGSFLADVALNFEARILRAIRDQYRSELRKSLTNEHSALMDVLFAKDVLNLPEHSVQLIESQLESLLGDGDALELMRLKYKSDDPLMFVRPKDLLESDPNTPEWLVDKFLEDFRDFLRNDKDSFNEVPITVTLTPKTIVKDSIWGSKDFTFVHNRFGKNNKWLPQAHGSGVSPFKGDWVIRKSHVFELRWNDDFTTPSKTLASGDAALAVRSPLAPYITAWSGTRSGTQWEVTALRAQGHHSTVPFRLKFSGLDLPDRPAVNAFDAND